MHQLWKDAQSTVFLSVSANKVVYLCREIETKISIYIKLKKKETDNMFLICDFHESEMNRLLDIDRCSVVQFRIA